MRTSEVKTRAPFDSLFPIQETTQRAIEESMKRSGYDPSQPITLWKEEGVVLDGHTRLAAARNAGIEEVAACELSFQDEKEAVEYSIHNQRDRRNMTDAQIVRLVRAMDKTEARGGDRKSSKAKSKASRGAIDQKPKKSAEKTAKAMGVSTRTVERVRELERDADEATKQAVQEGTKTINKALKETRESRKKGAKSDAVMFKEADRGLGFAKWIWEPATERSGVVTWDEKQLDAPKNTAVNSEDPSARFVLVCPSLDFSSPRLDEYRKEMLKVMMASKEFTYLIMIGKAKASLTDTKLPDNVWVGVRLSPALKPQEVTNALRKVSCKVKFLIWSPWDGDLALQDLSQIDWIVFDAAHALYHDVGTPEDDWRRTEAALKLAREDGRSVYFTPDFKARPMEYPILEGTNEGRQEEKAEEEIESQVPTVEGQGTLIDMPTQRADEDDRGALEAAGGVLSEVR